MQKDNAELLPRESCEYKCNFCSPYNKFKRFLMIIFQFILEWNFIKQRIGMRYNNELIRKQVSLKQISSRLNIQFYFIIS